MAETRGAARAQRLSAGVVVVRAVSAGWLFLLLRAYRNWDFPKGSVELGEEPLSAALREVREETTLTDLEFRWGHGFRETAPYGKGKVARYYLAETRTAGISLPVSPELGRPEHDEWRWVDREALAQLAPPRLEPITAWATAVLDLRS